ncbi:MAG: YiiX/YebB-like N1pC/P60 family cysteine hydrolase [Hyphomicrobium sp.]
MPPPLPSQQFLEDLTTIETLAWTPVRRASDLARNLDDIYQRAANAKFAYYDLNAVARAAPDLMYRLFDLRIALRSRIPEFEQKGFMTKEVAQGLRNVFRVLRYVSDMLGEIAIGHERLEHGEPTQRAFTGGDRNTLVNYAYQKGVDLPLQSGDVILVRGHLHNSAAIARIGDVDSQFSHIGIVYIDADKKGWMVESLIEEGAVISPLGAALDHGLVRAVLYRHKNDKLASRAAEAIHAYVAASRGPSGKPILYDFSMRLDERRDLFCSKLVRLAYEKGSNAEMKLPSYQTLIHMKNDDFLRRIGVACETTFAPADIDLESCFDLVAEWQDYRETSNTRLQDFTMDKLFSWMETHDLKFQETFLIRVVAMLGRFSAKLSSRARDLLASVFPRVPPNMRKRTIATVAMLHKTAEPLYHELQEYERRRIAETGAPLHGLEILDLLEGIRIREKNRIGYLRPRRGSGTPAAARVAEASRDGAQLQPGGAGA